jgi:parallel beta-helix repeat protein
MLHRKSLVLLLTLHLATIYTVADADTGGKSCGLDGKEFNDVRNIVLDPPASDYSPASPNNVTVIDFESFSDYQNINGLNLGGVTLTNPDNGIVEVSGYYCGGAYHSPTKSIIPGNCADAGHPLIGIFDCPATYIGLWGGDKGEGDIDSWQLEAFDAPVGGNSLGIASSGNWNGYPYRKLEISAPNIRRFQARWTGSGSPIAFDDLEFLVPLSLNKVSDINDNDCVRPGRKITYTISYEYKGDEDDNFIVIDYLPAEVDYNSSTPQGNYNALDRTVTWELGTLSPPASGTLELSVIVNSSLLSGQPVINVVEIAGSFNSVSDEVSTAGCYTGDIADNVICVDRDATAGLDNGISWDNAFLDFNDALAEANYVLKTESNCEIWVAAGTYKPPYQLSSYWNATFRIPPGNIAIRGHFGGIGRYETSPQQRDFNNPAFEMIFDGRVGSEDWERANYLVTCDDIGDGLILDGLTITGTAYGGLYINNYSDPSIIKCKFNDNYMYGIYAGNFSYPDVTDCIFLKNVTAGVCSSYSAWPYVKNCLFDGGNSDSYGLQGSSSEMLVENCIIRRYSEDGMNFTDSHLTVTGCTVENNSGSGIYCNDSYLDVSNCSIAGNNNHGILTESTSFPTITNSIICRNKDNGIYTKYCEHIVIKNNWLYQNGDVDTDSGLNLQNSISPPLVRNNTIVGNSPYGIYVYYGRDPCLVNDIIYGNGSTPEKNIFSERGLDGISASYCCIEGGFPGMEIVSCEPGFRNPADDDYHLKDDSNCINMGSPSADYTAETDIDGRPRVIYGRADLGADEWANPPDYNFDGFIDFFDFAQLADAWLSEAPDISLDADNDVDIDDLYRFTECWLWTAWRSKADYNKDNIVDFSDFAVLANAWLTENASVSLDIDSDVDIDDLAKFCEDWLWTLNWD